MQKQLLKLLDIYSAYENYYKQTKIESQLKFIQKLINIIKKTSYKMSLLLNLLNYSSSLSNQSKLMSIPQSDRSVSVCYKKSIQQSNQRTKLASKSLSKLLPQKNQTPIDPKSRILHRISHFLHIKCKKQFYSFFVKLQSIKKNNLYLDQNGQFTIELKIQKNGQIKKNTLQLAQTVNQIMLQNQQDNSVNVQQNKNIIVQQNITLKERLLKNNKPQQNKTLKKQRIQQFCKKIDIFIQVYQGKQLQKTSKNKHQFIKIIKLNYLYKDKLRIFIDKVQKIALKFKKNQFIKLIKKNNQQVYKCQILISLIQSLIKKYAKFVAKSTSIEKLAESFTILKLYSKNQQQKIASQSYIIESMFKFKSQKALEQIKPVILRNEEKQYKKMNPIPTLQHPKSNQLQLSNQNFNQKNCIDTFINPSNNPSTFIQPTDSLQWIPDKIHNIQNHSFNKNQISIFKAYKPQTFLKQQAFTIKQPHLNDKISKFCCKNPRNYLLANFNDQNAQQIFLFQQHKNTSSTKNSLKQSIVTPYNKSRSFRQSLKHNEFRKTKRQDIQFSQISQIQYLRSDKSFKSLINDNRSSAFGSQAVSFKNSLVQQRQSIKKGQPNLIQQYTTVRKFETIEKMENKYDYGNKSGNFSKKKLNQQLVKEPTTTNIQQWKGFMKDINIGNQKANINLLKGRKLSLPSNQRSTLNNNINHLFRYDKTDDIQRSFKNISIIQSAPNQKIYPTRDIKIDLNPHYISSKVGQQITFNQSSVKCIKQRGYIKVLSKK